MGSFTYYKNITVLTAWAEKTMNTANVNGYHGVKDMVQSIVTAMLEKTPEKIGVKFLSTKYFDRALSNREFDGVKYASKFYDGAFDFEALEEEFLYHGEDALLKGGLSELTFKQGQVLTLYLEGYKLGEIADLLNVGKAAISNTWSRIKKALKESDTFKDNFGSDYTPGYIASSEDYLIRCIDSTLGV